MKFLWLIFQSFISTWVLLLCFYLVMHDWQHFWTRLQGRLWKLARSFDFKRWVEKLEWGRIKRAEGENGCIGRGTNGKWRTQGIWIASLRGWGPRRSTAQLKTQAPSGAKEHRVVKFRLGMLLVIEGAQKSFCIALRPAEEDFLTAKSMPSQSRKHSPQLQSECTPALPEENWATDCKR